MGQLMSILGVLYIKNCNISETVDCLSLFPPSPPYYRLEKDEKDEKEETNLLGKYEVNGSIIEIPQSIHIESLKVNEVVSICVFHYQIPKSQQVLIFSHGNASDLGFYVDFMQVLGDSLGINIICYDYEGYGCSTGKLGSDCLVRDLQEVYSYANKIYHQRDIFFLGDGLGSVPACKVAALLWREYRSSKLHDKKQIPLGGVILQSALYSGKTALIGGLLLGPQDPYDNGSDIGFIECPIYHIHGQLDNVVHISNGIRLYQKSRMKYPPWWVEDGDHCNLFSRDKEAYIENIRKFLNHCSTNSSY